MSISEVRFTDGATGPGLTDGSFDTGAVSAELAKRFKDSTFQLAIQDVNGEPHFVLRSNTEKSNDSITVYDFTQPLITLASVKGIVFTKTGVALRLPYGYYPILKDAGFELHRYEVGEGQQLYIYIPYDDFSDTGLMFSDRMFRMSADYEQNSLRGTNKVAYKIGVVNEERSGESSSVHVPVFLLYPPDFDYFKTYRVKPSRVRTDSEWTFEGGQDVCLIVDDSGSASGMSPFTKLNAILDPKSPTSLMSALTRKKSTHIHLLSSTSSKVDVVTFNAPDVKVKFIAPKGGEPGRIEFEGGEEAVWAQRLMEFRNTLIASLAAFIPTGEEENLGGALARCSSIIGMEAATDLNRANVFLLTDEEATLPFKYLERDAVFIMSPVPADAGHVALAQALNLPLALAEQLFDPLLKDDSGGEKEINELIENVRKRISSSDANFETAAREVMAFYKNAHNDVRGEMKFRIMLSLLTLVPPKEAGDVMTWLTGVINDKNLDYPAKRRAVYLIGFYGNRGNSSVFELLMGLKKEIKDERLRHDISRAIGFLSSLERAKALWEIAEVDPNGVDMDEVRSCGINDYTVNILSHIILEGMGDVRKAAIEIVNDMLSESMSDLVFDEVVKLNATQLMSLYWKPTHIAKLKDALIRVQSFYGPEEKMSKLIEEAIQGLGDASLIISPKVTWEERGEFSLNRINSPHYFVRASLETGLGAIGALRPQAETEEAFIFIKDDEGGGTWYEHGDKETLGSTQPLPAHLMSEKIKGEAEAIVEVHLHPGQATGGFNVNDVSSIPDIIYSLISSAAYRELYSGVSYEHRIITPNGTFVIRPKELSAEEIADGIKDPASEITAAIVAYAKYLSDVMNGSHAADIEEIKKLLSPIVDVEFVKGVIPAVVSGNLTN